ncbi:MAG: pentapeptide repeat-containing protein [Christensenellaceae bacterium]|jgi:uncharacterized protein YjbI with pentapeptide repeats/DNA-binding XRE family transcriptional regulator|nr:pentapeptide repeat-containing protein [Christensenellaceae bacterium]
MLNANIIGEKITAARKARGYSQAQLGELLSVSPQAVGKWERGESMPDILLFNTLANVLGVDLNYFSDRTAPETGFSAAPEERVQQSGEKDNIDDPIKADTDDEAEDTYEDGGFEDGGGEFGKGFAFHGRHGRDFDGADFSATLGESIKDTVKNAYKAASARLNMGSSAWRDSDFSGLKNTNGRFSYSDIDDCLFVGADLSKSAFKGNSVEDCDFTNAVLEGSKFLFTGIKNCTFKGGDLTQAEFKMTSVLKNNFSNVKFKSTGIKTCTFNGNTLSGAVWDKTTFSFSQITNEVFEGDMTECAFIDCDYKNVEFKNVNFKDCFFKNVKLKRVVFTNCTADAITYAFLKNTKADLTGVSLTENR